MPVKSVRFFSIPLTAAALLSAAGALNREAAAESAITPPEVPAPLKVAATETPVFEAIGNGVQIFRCRKRKDGTIAWTFAAPDAKLTDPSGKQIGKHYRSDQGPAWELDNGNRVTAALKAKVPAPGGGAAPWLLLEARTHKGEGPLSKVSSIQRVATKGGLPPQTGCDGAHEGAEVRIPYEATYYFYAVNKR